MVSDRRDSTAHSVVWVVNLLWSSDTEKKNISPTFFCGNLKVRARYGRFLFTEVIYGDVLMLGAKNKLLS